MSKPTRLLLAAGIIPGPLFYVLSIVQMFIRMGFDIRRHALSMLLFGDLGWIQTVNFLVSGFLIIALAIGIRTVLKGTKGGLWGPLLIGIFGLSLLVAGIFVPDPAFGFPPGATEGIPSSMSAHNIVHSFAFMIGFGCIIAACFVLARTFAYIEARGMRNYSIVSGIAAPVFIVLSNILMPIVGVLIAVGAAIAFGWITAIAVRFGRSSSA